jgi:hypothetical protein
MPLFPYEKKIRSKDRKPVLIVLKILVVIPDKIKGLQRFFYPCIINTQSVATPLFFYNIVVDFDLTKITNYICVEL